MRTISSSAWARVVGQYLLALALDGVQLLLEAGAYLLRLVAGDHLGAAGVGGVGRLALDVGEQALDLRLSGAMEARARR